jgi:predicted kinase
MFLKSIIFITMNVFWQLLNSEWWLLLEGGHVAVLDATNTTKERRALVWDRLKGFENVQVMFIELICDNVTMLEENYTR